MSPDDTRPTWAAHLEAEGRGKLPPEIKPHDVQRWPVETSLEPTGRRVRDGAHGGLSLPEQELWAPAWCAEVANGLMPLLDNLRGSEPARGTLAHSARADDLGTLSTVVHRLADRPTLREAVLTLLRLAGAEAAAILLYRDDVEEVDRLRRTTRVVAYGPDRLMAAQLRRHGVIVDLELKV